MNEDYLVHSRWLITAADQPVITDGALLIRAGEIAAVGEWHALRASYPDVRVVGNGDCAVIPGLINAHHHSHAMSGIQHGVMDDLLEPWILAWAGMRPLDRYLNTLVSAGIQLGAGVTSVVDMMGFSGGAEQFAATTRQALSAFKDAGIRAALAPGVTTRSHFISGDGEDAEFLKSLPDDIRSLAEHLQPPADLMDDEDYFAVMDDCQRETAPEARLDLWYGPPGPQWVSENCLLRCVEKTRAWQCRLQTHINESFYEKLLGPRHHGCSMIEHLDRLDALGPHFTIAHGTWLNATDIALLTERGAAVSHNPSSNLRLRAGVAPLSEFIQSGLTTGIGMDATTLNEDEDMFAEIRLALRLQMSPFIESDCLSVEDIFNAATVGGAGLLGKSHHLGRLQPGYSADFVILDLDRICWPWAAPEAEPMALVLMRARREHIHQVFIAGESVWLDGRPTRFDLDDAARELAKRTARLEFPVAGHDAAKALMPYLRTWYASWDKPELKPWRIYGSKK